VSTKVHHFTNVVHAQRRRYREVLDVDPVYVDIRLCPGPVLPPGESVLDIDPVYVDIRLRPRSRAAPWRVSSGHRSSSRRHQTPPRSRAAPWRVSSGRRSSSYTDAHWLPSSACRGNRCQPGSSGTPSRRLKVNPSSQNRLPLSSNSLL